MSAISRVAEISQVHLVELKSVCFPGMAFPCRCFMESILDPLTGKKGLEAAPHPCLVEVQRRNGTKFLKDALVVVPEDAPVSDPFHDHLYAAALRAIRRTYSRTTGSVFRGRNPKRPLFDFRGISWEEPPFACAKHASKKVNCWSPLVLRKDYMQTNRERDWFILNSWKDWQAGAVSFIERTNQFKQKFGLTQATERYYARGAQQDLDTFRKRLAELGLPATAVALTGKPAVVLSRKKRVLKGVMNRQETPVIFSDLPKELIPHWRLPQV